jgi:hypothetical protein
MILTVWHNYTDDHLKRNGLLQLCGTLFRVLPRTMTVPGINICKHENYRRHFEISNYYSGRCHKIYRRHDNFYSET